jgi:hypothetical protein
MVKALRLRSDLEARKYSRFGLQHTELTKTAATVMDNGDRARNGGIFQ